MPQSLLALTLIVAQLLAGGGEWAYLCLHDDGTICGLIVGPGDCCCHALAVAPRVRDHRHGADAEHGSCCGHPSADLPECAEARDGFDQARCCTHVPVIVASDPSTLDHRGSLKAGTFRDVPLVAWLPVAGGDDTGRAARAERDVSLAPAISSLTVLSTVVLRC